MNTSQWLKNMLTEHDLTYRAMAELCRNAGWNIQHSVIGKLINEQRALKLEEFVFICQVLSVEPSDAIQLFR